MSSMRRSLLRRYRLCAPYLARHRFVLLAFLLLGNVLAMLCFPQIEAALSLSPSAPRATLVRTTATVVALAHNFAPRVLAVDTFQRPNQHYWGLASDGKAWQDDASNEGNFAISAHAGVIKALPQPIYCNAFLGPREANVELTFNAALSQYQGSLLGAVVRWSNAQNFYALTLDGQTLMLTREMDGMQIPLQSVTFPARAGALYTFRLRATGAQLFAMVWPTGQPAPVAWQISASDGAFSTGLAGLRVLIQGDAQARITSYQEVQL